MPKKKVFAPRNLKDSYQIYHSDQGKEKKKIKVFSSQQFYASLKTKSGFM